MLRFKDHEAVGLCQDTAFDLVPVPALLPTSTTGIRLKRMTTSSNHHGERFFTAVVHGPKLYWMSLQKTASLGKSCITHREFAYGSSIVISFEQRGSESQPCMTVFWANAQILAGEAQFSQLMRTLFGNFGERGFDSTESHNGLPPGSFIPAQDTPCSLRLPESEMITLTTNIELGESTFVAEGRGAPDQGTGPSLVQMELGSTKIQHTLTAGM